MSIESEMERTMSDLLGDWKAKRDVPTQMGFTAFTIPEKSIISVKQHDVQGRKILVEAGPTMVDWKHKNFLHHFERVT